MLSKSARLFLWGALILGSVLAFGSVDSDGDGSDDTEEALAGTDPLNSDERPYWWKTFNGESTPADGYGENFGVSTSAAGDVNNDGYDDILVGAHSGDHNGQSSGSVRVLSGKDGAVLYNFYGDNPWDYLGASLSGAGDVNGDGFDDVVVGVPGDDSNVLSSGSVRVFSGLDGSVLYNFNNALFGYSVSGAGDVNNDGYDDIVAGAPSYNDEESLNSGLVQVFSGSDGSVLYTFHGSALNYGQEPAQFGHSVSGAGDVNNDGYPDIVVGAMGYRPDYDNRYYDGYTRVFSGLDGSELYTFSGDSSDNLGFSVSGAGDVNNDGHDDVMVSSKTYSDGEYVYPTAYLQFIPNLFWATIRDTVLVFSGLDGTVLYTLDGSNVRSFSGAGDVNNDEYDDIVIGRDNSAEVLSGRDGAVLYTFYGDDEDDNFGRSVSGAGDLNNDGYPDILVGASGDDNNGANSGSARVFLSSDLANDVDLDFIVNSADSDDDNDGILDDVENSYDFLDPLNSADALLDQDGDGFSNLREVIASTDLEDSSSKPDGIKFDFNGDYIADFFWRDVNSGRNSVWAFNNSVQPSGIGSPSLSADWQLEAAGDFNGDGIADILWRNINNGRLSIWRYNENAKPSGYPIVARSMDWELLGSGDYNGDGRDDLAWRQIDTGRLTLWLMDENGLPVGAMRPGRSSDWTLEASADVNDDGFDDLVWRHRVTGRISVWHMNSSAQPLGSTVGFVEESLEMIGAGDINGDGFDDLAWRDSRSGQLLIWYMNQNSRPLIIDRGRVNTQLDVGPIADYNGDGRADFVWRNPETGRNNFWLSIVGGTFKAYSTHQRGLDWQMAQ